jgi:hypothetical protein
MDISQTNMPSSQIFYSETQKPTFNFEFNMTFDSDFKYCNHCGMWHQGICSRIKSIEYYPNGMIKRIEYHDQFASVDLNLVNE